MILKYANERKPNRTTYVGNMLDLLHIVSETKQEMIEQYGLERGQQEFAKLKAKDVLDKYATQQSVH